MQLRDSKNNLQAKGYSCFVLRSIESISSSIDDGRFPNSQIPYDHHFVQALRRTICRYSAELLGSHSFKMYTE